MFGRKVDIDEDDDESQMAAAAASRLALAIDALIAVGAFLTAPRT